MTSSTLAWDTRGAREPAFERRWEARLARTPHAGFALDLAFLRHEAAHGRHAVTVLVDEDDRAGAVVWRASASGWVSGWPWRWQAVLEGVDRADPRGGDAAAWQWLFRRARGVVSGRLVRFHAPHPPESGVHSVPGGITVIYDVAHDDAGLNAAMSASKKRMLKRAMSAGYHVHAPRSRDDLRAFAGVDYQLRLRKGLRHAAPPPPAPAPGESWLEWELPWMWLLVASLDGVIEAGVGDGVHPGGMVDGRAGASSLRARRDGAFALLSLEEARRARDGGHRWINLGGATDFKREFTGPLGTPVQLHCWMGVGSPWALGQHGEILFEQLRHDARRWVRASRLNRVLRIGSR